MAGLLKCKAMTCVGAHSQDFQAPSPLLLLLLFP
jgi:hypothetical protein